MARAVDLRVTDEMLRHQLDLLRLEAGSRRKVLGLINQLQARLAAMLASQDLTAFTKARTQALIADARATVDAYYARAQRAHENALDAAAATSARHTVRTLEGALAVDLGGGLPSATYLERAASNALIMGAPSAEWWSRQSRDTAFRFANAVRQGIAAGDTTDSIVARVAGRRGYPGIMDVARGNARSLVHTSIQEVANEARMETFRQNDDVVEGMMQVSTLDGNTTDVCIAYANMEWTLDEEPIDGSLPFDGGPPRHWGCRSVLVPVTKTFRQLGIKAPEVAGKGTRASALGQVPADLTFDKFLSRRTPEQQDEQLGKGRADLWRRGVITLPQLLDQKGNPLTLEELKARYG